MTEAGNEFGVNTPYGSALVRVGQTEQRSDHSEQEIHVTSWPDAGRPIPPLSLCFDGANAPFYYSVGKRRPYWARRPKSYNASYTGPKFPQEQKSVGHLEQSSGQRNKGQANGTKLRPTEQSSGQRNKGQATTQQQRSLRPLRTMFRPQGTKLKAMKTSVQSLDAKHCTCAQ